MANGLQNYIVKETADGITVNTLVETITSSNLISANTVAVGDILTLFARVKRTPTAPATFFTFKIYFNTSSSLSGATLIATNTLTGVNGNTVDFGRIFVVKSVTNTQGFNASTYTNFARYQVATSLTDSNIDWTVDQYLIISIALSSASEVAKSSGCLLLKD
jgi:hypothetical protein